MSHPADNDSANRPGQHPVGGDGNSWSAALATLVAARIELLRLESREAASRWAKTAALLAIAAVAALVAWLAIVAGTVAALAAATGCAWHWLALGAALLHLIGAGCCLLAARSSKPPAFPLTRNEFTKDREWFKSLATPRK